MAASGWDAAKFASIFDGEVADHRQQWSYNQDFSFDTYVPPPTWVDYPAEPEQSEAHACSLALQVNPETLQALSFRESLQFAAVEAYMSGNAIPHKEYSTTYTLDHPMPVDCYGKQMNTIAVGSGGTTWYASDCHFENSCIKWWHRGGVPKTLKGFYWFHFKDPKTNLLEYSCDFDKAEKAKKHSKDINNPLF